MHRFLRLGSLLLCTAPGMCAALPAPLPPGQVTPETLTAFCAKQSHSACTVPLQGQYTLTIARDWQLPGSMHLHFQPGSTLRISEGVLHFAGASVEAPAREGIFPNGERVRELSAARPEWFASLPQQDPLPATALAAAYEATEPWGTIYLQPRRYVSPFSGCPPASVSYLSPRTLVGAGRPLPDDPGRPTHLEGGTILVGGLVGTGPVRLARLGIDVGPQASAQLLHGCRPPAVFIEQPSHQFVSGDRLQDVSVLTSGAPDMHSVMIAGHQNTDIRDLWIWTLGGTHGLVMKSSQSVVDGLHCRGAGSDCLIIKSDYETDFLGRATEDRISHVDIQPLQPGEAVGGIVVDSRWDTVHSLRIEDVHETGTYFGLAMVGSSFFRPRNISVAHWTADLVTGECLYALQADHVQITDLRCGLQPWAQAGVELHGGRDTLLRNASFRCQGEPAQCAAGHADAVLDSAQGTILENIRAEGLGGYLLRSTGHAPLLPGVQVIHMGGRLFATYRISLLQRLQGSAGQIRPDLRILYTAVTVRAALRPALYGFIGTLFLCVVAWEWKYPLRWPVTPKRFRRSK